MTRLAHRVKSATATSASSEDPIAGEPKGYLKALYEFSYIGIFFAVSIVLGLLGGAWVDKRYHTSPLFTLVGVLFGVAAGFRELYRLGKKYRETLKHDD